MKLKHTFLITIVALTGIIFINCTHQKHVYGNAYQTESKKDTICLNTKKQNIIPEADIMKPYQLETISKSEKTVLVLTTPHVVLKNRIVDTKVVSKIRKYEVLYIDASNYLEKKEKRKCYDAFKTNEEVIDCGNSEEIISDVPFLFPILCSSSALFGIVALFGTIRKYRI